MSEKTNTKKRHPAVARLLEEFSPENWLTPDEVAAIFRVDPKTVTRWNNSEKFTVVEDGKPRPVRTFRTPGNHRRYFAPDIKQVMDNNEYRPAITG